MATRRIDELNNLRSIPYDKYFGEMAISRESKKKRIELAEKIEEAVLSVFSLIDTYNTFSVDSKEEVKNRFIDKLIIAIGVYIVVDDYVKKYLDEIVSLILDATYAHLSNEYYLSDDRAMYIAENEANSLMNYEELQEALLMGYTEKQWLSMEDNKVRHTHEMLDLQTIPIEEPFESFGSLMMFPKDRSLGASDEEIVNCRCSIRYI